MHPNLTVLDHPLARHHMSVLRDATTGQVEFRRSAHRIGCLLAHAAAAGFAETERRVDTPLEPTVGSGLSARVVAVPVLRAGLGLLEGVLETIPDVAVGHLGVFRDESTALPQEYYVNLPPLAGAEVLVLEPMLATGGSLAWALDRVREHGPARVTALVVCAAPPGLERLAEQHPDVAVITASVDRGLDDNFYIRPGLGDMGDRLFGTT